MSDLEARLVSIRQAVEHHPPRGRAPRYPEPLRQQVVLIVNELRAQGWSTERITGAVGICWATLRRWPGVDVSPRRHKPKRHDRLVPVRIVEPPRKAPLATRTFTLQRGDGWRVDGLSLDDLAWLLREVHS